MIPLFLFFSRSDTITQDMMQVLFSFLKPGEKNPVDFYVASIIKIKIYNGVSALSFLRNGDESWKHAIFFL